MASFILLSLHPLFWITLSVIAGIVLASTHVLWYHNFMLSSCIILMCTLASRFKFVSFKMALIISSMALFQGIGWLRYHQCFARYVKIVENLTQAPFNAYAKVVDIYKSSSPRKNKIALTVLHSERNAIIQPLDATIQLYVPHFGGIQVGDLIFIQKLCCKKVQNRSYERFLQKEAIHATLFLSTLRYKIIQRPFFSIARWRYNIINRLIASVQQKVSVECCTLFTTLFLGCKPDNPSYELVKNSCLYWGIIHYLARSGLHIMLILTSWRYILGYIALPFYPKNIFLVCLIILYYLLTGTSISFIRAFITFFLSSIALMHAIPFKLLHIFTLITLLMLLYNPFILFFLDFQLSFGITWALAWFQELRILIQRFYINIENK